MPSYRAGNQFTATAVNCHKKTIDKEGLTLQRLLRAVACITSQSDSYLPLTNKEEETALKRI
jgi:hypothetical protein